MESSLSLFLYWEVKGNLILHLEPEPLPTVTGQIQDEELDLSMEQESLGETENSPVTEAETICSREAEGKTPFELNITIFPRKKMLVICQQEILV